MVFRVIPEQRWRVGPWPNGGGTTHEIVRAGRGGDEPYVARLSVATIGRAGPFSAFPGRARTLWLLGGTLSLSVDDAVPRPLATHDPFGFSGDAHVLATPGADPVRVLNLIATPGSCRVTHHGDETPVRLHDERLAALVILAGQATLALSGTKVVVPLPTHATVIVAGEEDLLVTPHAGCMAVHLALAAPPDVTWQLPISG